MQNNTFLFELQEQFLLYAPLHGVSALVNKPVLPGIKLFPSLTDERIPQQRKGEFVPDFLGLIPTRDCNLDCRYCGFRQPQEVQTTMSTDLAMSAIRQYAQMIARHGHSVLNIHFFGGEPFFRPSFCKRVIQAAHLVAREFGLQTVFEAATNGFMSIETAKYISDSIDHIVLSLDGPPEFQNAYRPQRNGRGSFDIVRRNARIFSDGPANFCIRACITSESVKRMKEIARFFVDLHPRAVSFETLQESAESMEAGIHPPDPWEFALNFIKAETWLQSFHIETIYATAEVDARRVTFCPLGRDAAIITADGSINGCYLMEKDWEARGLNLHLGTITSTGKWILNPEAIEQARACSVTTKPRCKNCFCKWHCAGGCHVNHTFPLCSIRFDDLCIQTRILSLFRILKHLKREDLFESLAQNRSLLEKLIHQDSDLLPEPD